MENKTPKNLTPSQLLTVMEAGLTLEFPSGYKMCGDINEGYIRLSTPFGSDGVWGLDIQGAKCALLDEKRYSLSNNS